MGEKGWREGTYGNHSLQPTVEFVDVLEDVFETLH